MSGPDNDLQDLLQTLDPTSRVLYSEAVLGRDAEEFIRSELGQAMAGMAQQDYAEAVLTLSEVGWWRKARVRQLQQKAANAKAFLAYLEELILRGRQAQSALEQQENSDG